MRVRPARKEDATAILSLLNPIIRDTTITFTSVEKTEHDIHLALEEHAAADRPYLVAEDDLVRGVTHYFPFRGGPGYRHTMEHSIYVDPVVNGQGIGRLLMAELEAQATARRVTNLIGAVSSENLNGLIFHEALGFQNSGRLKAVGQKFGRSLDLVLMQKSLVADTENLA